MPHTSLAQREFLAVSYCFIITTVLRHIRTGIKISFSQAWLRGILNTILKQHCSITLYTPLLHCSNPAVSRSQVATRPWDELWFLKLDFLMTGITSLEPIKCLSLLRDPGRFIPAHTKHHDKLYLTYSFLWVNVTLRIKNVKCKYA